MQVTGPDAASFLQGQFSNDLSGMTAGDVVYGLWLDRRGKILADSFVLCRGAEAFLVVSVHCSESVVFDRLDAYLIMEEVELRRSTEGARGICVFGEEVQAAACAVLGVAFPSRGGFAEKEGLAVFWGRRGNERGLEFVSVGEGGTDCIEVVSTELRGLTIDELSSVKMVALSIDGKVPQIGIGFGESDLPQELGMELDAVSFRKGCYLGQEVMARLNAMGRVRKRLARFRILDADTLGLEELPLDLLDEAGKRVGQLRVVAYSDTGGIGLGVVSTAFLGGVLFAGDGRVGVEELEETVNG